MRVIQRCGYKFCWPPSLISRPEGKYLQVFSRDYNVCSLLDMSDDSYDTGVPAPQIQSLLDNVDIDESVASCISISSSTEPKTKLTNYYY
jgi:hypothetical protein